MVTKKHPALRENKILNQAEKFQVSLLDRFERTVSILGRSQSTFNKLGMLSRFILVKSQLN
jgi:hypothetical protein